MLRVGVWRVGVDSGCGEWAWRVSVEEGKPISMLTQLIPRMA